MIARNYVLEKFHKPIFEPTKQTKDIVYLYMFPDICLFYKMLTNPNRTCFNTFYYKNKSKINFTSTIFDSGLNRIDFSTI